MKKEVSLYIMLLIMCIPMASSHNWYFGTPSYIIFLFIIKFLNGFLNVALTAVRGLYWHYLFSHCCNLVCRIWLVSAPPLLLFLLLPPRTLWLFSSCLCTLSYVTFVVHRGRSVCIPHTPTYEFRVTLSFDYV